MNARVRPGAARSRPWQALAAALSLEFALVLAVFTWLATRPPTLTEQVIALSIESIAPVRPDLPPRETPKPTPLPPPVKAVAPTPPKAPPKTVTQATATPTANPTNAPTTPLPAQAQPEPMAAALPSAPIPPAVPTTPAPTPQQVQPSTPAAPDPTPAYNARLTAAAQAAFTVPGAVTSLNFKGRARVGFKLRNGQVSNVSLIQSSGLGAMDRAALQAVQTASYPAAPPALQDRDIAYEIWVTHAPAL
jgi:periplasmic protein TonB